MLEGLVFLEGCEGRIPFRSLPLCLLIIFPVCVSKFPFVHKDSSNIGLGPTLMISF